MKRDGEEVLVRFPTFQILKTKRNNTVVRHIIVLSKLHLMLFTTTPINKRFNSYALAPDFINLDYEAFELVDIVVIAIK